MRSHSESLLFVREDRQPIAPRPAFDSAESYGRVPEIADLFSGSSVRINRAGQPPISPERAAERELALAIRANRPIARALARIKEAS